MPKAFDFNVFPRISQNHFKQIRMLRHKKGRTTTDRFFAEGLRLCEEALSSDFVIEEALVTETLRPNERLEKLVADLSRKVPLVVVSEKQFQMLADTDTPQGIGLIMRRKIIAMPSTFSGIWIALEDLQDPGNMGTIIRTALWFGIQGVMNSPGTVELYNPKTIRSSMGALFHIPVLENIDLVSQLRRMKQAGFTIIGTTSHGGEALEKIPKTRKAMLVIGTESEGMSPELAAQANFRITIPRIGGGESLNAAVSAGILLHQMTLREKI